jgi:[acyl-carrier-protein] S-malonyltransferase
MTQLAFVFPGQGSQSVGMMEDWGDFQPLVKKTFEQASAALGEDLEGIVREGPPELLNRTDITQPVMLASGIAAWRVWRTAKQPNAIALAGHSLGEYTALVAAGALDFGDAIQLVAERGRLMQQAVAEGEGAMAAIIGLSDEDVQAACNEIKDAVVSPVNYNSPGQVVIAGEREAVEKAMEVAKKMGAKRALPLPVSVPSHCSLMKPAADALYEKLKTVGIQLPKLPIIHNQNADIADSADGIRWRLRDQLYQPVLWVDCVQMLQRRGADTLVELGPGKVLTGLARRIDKSLKALPVHDAASLEKAMEQLSGETDS